MKKIGVLTVYTQMGVSLLTVMEFCIYHLSSPLQGGITDNKPLLYHPSSHGKSSERTLSNRVILRHYLSGADHVN